MSLNAYINGGGRREKRPAPVAISLAAHGAAIFLLMHTPEIRLPEPAKSEYKQAIEGKEDKLVWFKFKKDLPDVTPATAKSESKPLRARVKASQEIVASRKDAPKRKQMVWTAAPELHETKPVELPNILAVRLPEIARAFVAPPEVERAEAAKVEVPLNAPELRTQALEPVKLTDAPKIAKPFVAPPTRVPVKIAGVAAPTDAPALEARLNAPDPLNYTFKSPARPFTAPPSKGAATNVRQVSVEAPPAVGGSAALTTPNDILTANSRDLNLAVVGLNPSNKPTALPTASSPGQFSAGPRVRPEGADSAGDGSGITVPDLFVRGGKEARPDLIAQTFAAPTSASNLRAAARLAEPKGPSRLADAAEPSHTGSAIKVSSGPDKRFNGRDVYMMAIQMPNLTSYSGSWLMWYADRTARDVGLAPVAAPVAHRKVDPKYVAAAAADRIEGKVRLACVIGRDGRVSGVEVIQGLDERLNQTAQEALAKWEFAPATRQGEPVDVDVVVEIPFRLAPHAQVPF